MREQEFYKKLQLISVDDLWKLIKDMYHTESTEKLKLYCTENVIQVFEAELKTLQKNRLRKNILSNRSPYYMIDESQPMRIKEDSDYFYFSYALGDIRTEFVDSKNKVIHKTNKATYLDCAIVKVDGSFKYQFIQFETAKYQQLRAPILIFVFSLALVSYFKLIPNLIIIPLLIGIILFSLFMFKEVLMRMFESKISVGNHLKLGKENIKFKPSDVTAVAQTNLLNQLHNNEILGNIEKVDIKDIKNELMTMDVKAQSFNLKTFTSAIQTYQIEIMPKNSRNEKQLMDYC